MKSFIKTVLGIAVCSVLGIAGFSADGDQMDSVIASVDGEPVSLGDIIPSCSSRERELQAALSGDELYKAVRDVRMKALDELINRKLILKDFESTVPFKVPEQAIERYIDDMALNAGVRSRVRFSVMVRESGMTMEELRRRARENIIIQAMRSRQIYTHVNVTPREVHEYFNAHPEKFSKPELWRISMLLVDKNAAGRDEIIKNISARMSGGSAGDFAALATKYSSGPGASAGGDLGALEPDDLRSEFRKAVGKPEIGRCYGPVRVDNGDVFLFITGIVPSEKADFSAESGKIRQELESIRSREALKKYIDRLRSNALIQYFL